MQSLDDDIARSEQTRRRVPRARAKQARAAARARAQVAYTSSGTQLAALVDSADTLDTARRAHLIDRVNAHDQDVYEELQKATRALHKQQRELRATRQAQDDALDELKAQGATIDAKLAQAEAQEQAQASAAAAQAAAATAADPTTTTEAGAPAAGRATDAAPPRPPAAPSARPRRPTTRARPG